jgi:cation:H+ antiporter
LDLLLLIAGIAGLLIGTELTIGGALAIARKHHLSEFFVGLIVLSIGSDLPEIAVAVDAGLKTLGGTEASGIVVGSAIGSVVAQIGFVLGIAGLLTFLTLPRRFIFKHGTVLLGATALLFLTAVDGVITWPEGLTMIIVYVMYVVVLLSRERVPPEVEAAVTEETRWPWLRITIGLALVIACSELTVESVVSLAYRFELNDIVISVLIIGLGTSLPELSISLAAIIKKKVHLSVGNIIGSNIFDTLVPISLAALLAPVAVSSSVLRMDLPYVFLLTAVVLAFFYRVSGLQRGEAAVILALYATYVVINLLQL